MYTYQAIYIERYQPSLTRYQMLLDSGWEPVREIAFYAESPSTVLCILRKPIPTEDKEVR